MADLSTKPTPFYLIASKCGEAFDLPTPMPNLLCNTNYKLSLWLWFGFSLWFWFPFSQRLMLIPIVKKKKKQANHMTGRHSFFTSSPFYKTIKLTSLMISPLPKPWASQWGSSFCSQSVCFSSLCALYICEEVYWAFCLFVCLFFLVSLFSFVSV